MLRRRSAAPPTQGAQSRAIVGYAFSLFADQTAAVVGSTTGFAAAAFGPSAPALYLGLIGCGFCLRMLSVPASLHSDRGVARMAMAGPSLKDAFMAYAEVAWHPQVMRNELELAHTKFVTRRRAVLRRFDTSTFTVQGLPFVTGFYMLLVFVAVVKVLPAAAVASQAAWFVGPLGIDPAFPLAAVITAANLDYCLTRRLGFGDHADNKIHHVRRMGRTAAAGATAVVAASQLVGFAAFAPAVAASASLAPHVAAIAPIASTSLSVALTCAGPFALGASLAGVVRTCLNALVPLKRLLRWPTRYPKEHGTYGEYAFAADTHYQREAELFQKCDFGHHHRNYVDAKRMLELDCDIQLQKHRLGRWLFRDTRYDHEPKSSLMDSPSTW